MAEVIANSNDSVVDEKSSRSTETSIKFNEEIFKKSVVYENLEQDIIITTGDKVRLILEEFKDNVKAEIDWATPVGIFITILATLVTTDFKKFINIEAYVWKALYIISGIICLIYCAKYIFKAICSRNKCSVQHVINELKNNNKKK